jgi:polyisoprenyl-phosphate glycosyltransferase
MISIVIPLFNEEKNVNHLYKRLIDSSPIWNEDYEVIFIDDGSCDDTLFLLREICKQDLHIKIIKLSRNFGHQAAISAGIKHAKGDAVIIMDGDLQDPPEELPRFLDKWREGYHVVYAIRRKRKENLFKKLAYRSFYVILKLISNINIPLDSGDFCVMDKKVVSVLNNEMIEHSRFVRGLRAYAGFKQYGVEYERAERAAGNVKYTFRKLLNLAIDGFFDFSTFPLRIATYLGFTIAIPSFFIGLFFVISRMLNVKFMGYSASETPGIASLAVGIFFLGGVIMVILGIIGEYIGKIYFEVKKRPFYIIDEIYNNN